jgi:hypothetical protein
MVRTRVVVWMLSTATFVMANGATQAAPSAPGSAAPRSQIVTEPGSSSCGSRTSRR